MSNKSIYLNNEHIFNTLESLFKNNGELIFIKLQAKKNNLYKIFQKFSIN